MSDDKDILQKRTWSTKQLFWAVWITGAIVFSAAMIWSRFVLIENAVTVNQQRNDKRYERANSDRENIWSELNRIKEQHK